MKKKILIIRSISMQQLDNLMKKVYREYPDAELYILTHSHAIERCKKYKNIKEVFDYGSIKNFSFLNIPKILKKHKFDIVIIPVTNITGAGFVNVQMMSLRIKSDKYFLYNIKAEKKEVKKSKIIFNLLNSVVFSVISITVTLTLSPVIIICLLLSILFYKN